MLCFNDHWRISVIWGLMFLTHVAHSPWKIWPTKKHRDNLIKTTQTHQLNPHLILHKCLCFPWCCVLTAGLCHPAVHPHSFDRRTLPALCPAHVKQLVVRLLLLLAVAAALVGAARGADAVCGRRPHVCSSGWGGGGVRMRSSMSLSQVAWLTEVVTGRGDRLGFDVDAVVGETGAPWPTERRMEEEPG